jgi:hypothetical protein
MTDKKKQQLSLNLPDEMGNDFEDDRDILTYKPRIEYQEPPVDPDTDGGYGDSTDEPETIEEARKEVEDLVEGYRKVEQLAELTQKRVDSRVGDYSIQLDPKVDSHVIAAVSRCFPEASDPTKISYEMYKQCLARQNNVDPDVVTKGDILEARKDSGRTNFGGYGLPPGLGRSEVSSPAEVVQPIDLQEFQDNSITELWKLLVPLVGAAITVQIIQHKLDTPHKPL